MPRAVHLRDGDGLALDSGELVRVEAAPEPLIEITAPNMPLLLRLAWHLGNRHLPTQLLGDGMRIRHRSDEHTSELQSLMRISYAVFCLKKKKATNQIDQHHQAVH